MTVTNSAGLQTGGSVAHGIFAQSVGGGGGSAGSEMGVVTVGGSGTGGGHSGTVTVDNSGSISVGGLYSRGIFTQSVGGGGGDAGHATGVIAIGGSGSSSSDGGNVAIANSGAITSTANAIYAQSIGGGGGTGGLAIGLLSGLVSIGGSGGGGGNSGTVTVTNSGGLATTEVNAAGIFAQSVGGGGGNGGQAVSVSIYQEGSVTIGGAAAQGGSGNRVAVTNSTGGSINTSGNSSQGILAQSIGGGGGNGGLSIAAGLTGIIPTVAIGGTGGAGGNGGEVSTTNSARIDTHGENAQGILAQSVGGGGGSGGSSVSGNMGGSAVALSLGGSGGQGGSGSMVTAHNSAAITTEGSNAQGILVQSVGGGGGSGGFSVAAAVGLADGVSVSLGGKGETGGRGGDVHFGSSGTISTSGSNAAGILAQSVGGGGGSGGFSVTAAGSTIASIGVSIGGGGSSGSTGGNLTITNAGSIFTGGSSSAGILAQSIGGGGGGGGWSASADITIGVLEEIPVSVGVGVSVGGNGGIGGAGGKVSLSNSGELISTTGDSSRGLFAQSVGGGGGSGGVSVAVSLVENPSYPLSAAVSVGGSGGSGNTGGAVTIQNAGAIITTGDNSQGIFAQSIGGGGGSGSFSAAVSGTVGTKSLLMSALSVALGGDGGTGGDSKNDSATGLAVKINSSGPWINTSGLNSQGILAQSIGGGGGNGGISLNLAGSLLGSPKATDVPLVSLGNKAGGAGNGAAVAVENSSSISTSGDYAQGILAQSVGGGGGAGGIKMTGSASFDVSETSISAGLSFGAQGQSGAGGGNADSVTVMETLSLGTAHKFITTEGTNAAGILAQSIGGGGGTGGLSIQGGAKISVSKFDLALDTNTGGSGAAGGSAGAVSVTSVSDIQTLGEVSAGIHAHSIGGGGGNGGIAIGASLDATVSFLSGGLHYTSGGVGGSGGDAQDTTVTSYGRVISTRGNTASGIIAQSVGGGGGTAGGSVNLGIGLEAGLLPSLTISNGAKGGAGGSSATVTVTNRSSIVTGAADTATGFFLTGNDSKGILAQSVGGGGGDGGFSISARGDVGAVLGGATISLGGEGGDGNKSGNVEVLSTGREIRTLGDRSAGIFAQSVGGGGGNGGFSVVGGMNSGIELLVSDSGGGGSNGNAGTVTVTNTGDIGTGFKDPDSTIHGHDAPGILAQSIGGGGGNGGFSVAGTVSAAGARITHGGRGSGGGNGDDIDVQNSGSVIATSGDRSAGILAQSIGGGGGNGGVTVSGGISALGSINLSLGSRDAAGGNAGVVSITSSSLILTEGTDAAGILAQSIGGGGGNAGTTVSGDLTAGGSLDITLGMSGTGTGNGSAVSAISTGSWIRTRGDRSSGIMAQSIGGGGGFGSIGISGSEQAHSTTLTLGGQGGGNGDGGAVTVGNLSAIRAEGKGSLGILAQSIGGGGGFVVTTALPTTGVAVLGGTGGTSGNGGQVTVSNAGSIITSSSGGYGIVAQSIGGGGGLAGYGGTGDIGGITTAVSGSGAVNSGNGGQVTITHAGVIATTGTASIGIVAQSVGGGGGLDAAAGTAGNSGGNSSGGSVTVSNNGGIFTSGAASHGIFAQSAGGVAAARTVEVTHTGIILTDGIDSDGIVASGNGSNISVAVLEGTVRGGSGAGTAVRILEGANNRLDNFGIILNKDDVQGNGVIATSGNDTVNNFGTIIGSVDLGGGVNAINNKTAAFFLTGQTVSLGTGTFTNEGTVAPGGIGSVLTTTVAGNYVQSASGIYAVDLDAATGDSDRIRVSGTSQLTGKIAPNITNRGSAVPGTQLVTILTGDGGVTSDGLEVLQPSAIAQYRLLYPTQNDVALASTINFSPAGLTGNQAAVANAINLIQRAGSSPTSGPVVSALKQQADSSTAFAAIVARLFDFTTIQGLAEAYDHLSPAPYLALTTATVFSNIRFGSEMFSCGTRDGDNRFAKEGRCVWTRLSGNDMSLGGSSDNLGYDLRAVSLSTGIQQQISGNLFGGFALSYENSSTAVSRYANSDGNRIQGGIMAKARYGATTLALGLTGGYGWFDTKRHVDIPSPGITAKAAQGIGSVSGHLRLAHTFERATWYLRPMLDGTVSYDDMGGFIESGVGGANLKVAGRDETTVSARPALEIGGELSFSGGTLARPYLRAGFLQFFSGTTSEITASFQDAPVGVAPFTVSNKLDSTMADLSAGFDILTTGEMVLRLEYSGLYSSNVSSHTGGFKFSYPF